MAFYYFPCFNFSIVSTVIVVRIVKRNNLSLKLLIILYLFPVLLAEIVVEIVTTIGRPTRPRNLYLILFFFPYLLILVTEIMLTKQDLVI